MVEQQVVVPIAPIQTIMMGLSIVPVLFFKYDVCANPECGIRYCVSIERKDIPTSELQKMMGIARQTQQVPPGFQGFNRQQRRHMGN